MALPSSGAISLSDVNVELGLSSTASISMNDATVRSLFAQQGSNAVDINTGHGKYQNWVTTLNNTGYSTASSDITVDSNGNIYTISNWANVAYNAYNAFVCKQNSDSSVAWIRSITQNATAIDPKKVIADSSGNVYACVSYGSNTCVIKFDSSGNTLWKKTYTVASPYDIFAYTNGSDISVFLPPVLRLDNNGVPVLGTVCENSSNANGGSGTDARLVMILRLSATDGSVTDKFFHRQTPTQVTNSSNACIVKPYEMLFDGSNNGYLFSTIIYPSYSGTVGGSNTFLNPTPDQAYRTLVTKFSTSGITSTTTLCNDPSTTPTGSSYYAIAATISAAGDFYLVSGTYLHKYSSSYVAQWSKRLPSSTTNYTSVRVFNGKVVATMLTTYGRKVHCFDESGNLLFKNKLVYTPPLSGSAGMSFSAYSSSLAIDQLGNIYVPTNFKNTVNYPTDPNLYYGTSIVKILSTDSRKVSTSILNGATLSYQTDTDAVGSSATPTASASVTVTTSASPTITVSDATAITIGTSATGITPYTQALNY